MRGPILLIVVLMVVVREIELDDIDAAGLERLGDTAQVRERVLLRHQMADRRQQIEGEIEGAFPSEGAHVAAQEGNPLSLLAREGELARVQIVARAAKALFVEAREQPPGAAG